MRSGELPRVFLEGCGVSGEWLDYAISTARSKGALDFYSCFVSYCTADEEFARSLHGRLKDNELMVWFAPEDMRTGDLIKVACL